MVSIEWKKTCCTGIPLLDTQNKHLVEMLNSLFEFHRIEHNPAALLKTLQGIYKHIREHFRQEEELYKQYLPEYLEEHQLQHSMFLENFDSAIENGISDSENLYGYIRDWVVFHIENMDMNCANKILMSHMHN